MWARDAVQLNFNSTDHLFFYDGVELLNIWSHTRLTIWGPHYVHSHFTIDSLNEAKTVFSFLFFQL